MRLPLIFGYLLSDDMQGAIKKFTTEVYNKATGAPSTSASSSSKAKPKADTAATFPLASDMFT